LSYSNEIATDVVLICRKAVCHGNSDTTFGQGTILEPSTSHISGEVELAAWATALVYIYARISQIAEIHTSFSATTSLSRNPPVERFSFKSSLEISPEPTACNVLVAMPWIRAA
jgi:hypothetical protein